MEMVGCHHALLSTKSMTLHLNPGGLLVRLEGGHFQGPGDMARLWMEILTGFLLILVKTVKDRKIPYDILIIQQRGLDLCLFRMILSLIILWQNLCLLTSCVKLLDIGVWMATKIKGTGDMSWSKLLTVKRTCSDQFFKLCKGVSFLADRENKVIGHPIKDMNFRNFLHIVGEDKYRKVNLCAVGSRYALPVSGDPTLVQIQQGSLGLGTWKEPITKFS